MTRAICLALSLAVTTSADAQTIYVPHGWTCADWASARSEKTALAGEYYLTGVLTGMALSSMQDFWRQPYPIEKDQVFFWMDQYCARNPLSIVMTGAFVLAEERLGKGWNDR